MLLKTRSRPLAEKDGTRLRAPKHQQWVATLPCVVLYGGLVNLKVWGNTVRMSEAHHMTHIFPKARALKAPDWLLTPLSMLAHRQLHARGDEAAFWRDMRILPVPICRALWEASVRAGRAEAVDIDWAHWEEVGAR